MAAMDQEKLSRMCSSINAAAGEYVSNVGNSVKELADVFNENWVSNSSRELTSEITEALNTLATDITKIFDHTNESIKVSVNNFNYVENENIAYPGFAFGTPATSMNINGALPNGKVGVADGADLNTINTPMGKLVSNVNSTLTNIDNTVKSADAFDMEEQAALSSAINKIRTKFEEAMDQLKDSLNTRMSKEISLRDHLNQTNKQNLES